jgi:Transglycosylase SLT domain
MAVPQRARLWLGAFAFSAALALSSSYAIHSATARNVKRTSSTDLTPTLAEQRSPPPETVVAAVLDAGRSTGIDPALLLTIAATESRFQANAKNRTSSATGLLQFTKQTWLENLKKFGGKHGLSHLAALIHRSGVGYLVARAPARNRISTLRNDPRIATLLAAERLDYQKEQSKDRHLQVVDFYLIHALGVSAGLFNALVLDWVSPKCNTLMQTAVG